MEQAFQTVSKNALQQEAEEQLYVCSIMLGILLTTSDRYVDYPDPIQIDRESTQNYGCNC